MNRDRLSSCLLFASRNSLPVCTHISPKGLNQGLYWFSLNQTPSFTIQCNKMCRFLHSGVLVDWQVIAGSLSFASHSVETLWTNSLVNELHLPQLSPAGWSRNRAATNYSVIGQPALPPKPQSTYIARLSTFLQFVNKLQLKYLKKRKFMNTKE